MNQYGGYLWSSYLFVAVGWIYLIITSIQKNKIIQQKIRQRDHTG